MNGAANLAELRLAQDTSQPPGPPEGLSSEEEFNEQVVPPQAWARLVHEWRAAHTVEYHRGRVMELLDAYLRGLADGLEVDPEQLRTRVIEVTQVP